MPITSTVQGNCKLSLDSRKNQVSMLSLTDLKLDSNLDMQFLKEPPIRNFMLIQTQKETVNLHLPDTVQMNVHVLSD